MLTSLRKCFYNSSAIETDLSDFLKMAITIMKTTFLKEEKKIQHTDYKNFSNNAFRKDLLLKASSNGHVSERDILSSFINTGLNALNKHMALLKRSMSGKSKPHFEQKFKESYNASY